MMAIPCVTVYLPTYNSEKTIDDTIRSITDQTHSNIDIHVVDNASKDRTVDIIRAVRDPRITIHTNNTHAPAAELNWNRCFLHPRGEYTIICHSDDIYTQNMFQKQVGVLEQNRDVGGVFTGSIVIDENGKFIQNIPVIEEFKNKKLDWRDILVATMFNGNTLSTPTALLRSEIYVFLLPFRFVTFAYSSDLDMWLRLAQVKRVMVIDEPLLQYRVGRQQDSTRIHYKRTAEEAFFRTMDHHIVYAKDIPRDAVLHYEVRRIEDKIRCIRNAFSLIGSDIPRMVAWGIKKKLRG